MSALNGDEIRTQTQIRHAIASAAGDIEARFIEQAEDPDAARALLDGEWRKHARSQTSTAVDPQPETFDFDAALPAPRYVVRGVLERATVNMLSGDTGSAKSIHADDLTVRGVQGEPWLGREIPEPLRVLYLDEENPERIVHSRLAALGMTNEHKDRLRYYRRKGLRLGLELDDKWVAWVREQCEDFRPDLLIVDTVLAAVSVEINDNDTVAKLYSEVLRPLAEDYDLALLMLHHERKPQAGETRHGGYAMMGARYWAGGADVHMTLMPAGSYVETPRDEGGAETRKEFRFQVEKARDGHTGNAERTAVEGVKEPQGVEGGWVLTQLRVEWLGRVSEGEEASAEESILRTMGTDENAKWLRKDVASAAGEDDPTKPSGTFIRAWANVKDAGLTEQAGKGARLTAKGKQRVADMGLPVG